MLRSLICASAIFAVGQAATAAYFLENNPNGSSIVSLQLIDGILSDPIRTSTGGYGSLVINSTTGTPVEADTLNSQGSVVVSGNKLFTVNSGSNTLAFFEIDPWNPFYPRLVRTIDTMGDFPISVTYHEESGKVCVLNGGARAGVACFDLLGCSYGSLLPIPLNETTPPTGPPSSAAQVKFNGDRIVVTIKNLNGGPGKLVVFTPQLNGTYSQYIYENPGIPGDFGFSNLNRSAIIMSDIMDAWIVNIDTYEAQRVDLGNASTTCWTVYDGRTTYIPDTGLNNIYEVVDGKLTNTIVVDQAGGGLYDTALADWNLHSLVAANGIISTNLFSGVQTFLNLTYFGNRQYYTGMARF